MSWSGEQGGGQGRKYIHVTETPDVRHITNVDVMHEESDVSVKGVGAFVGILFAGLVLIAALMVGLYKAFEWNAKRQDARIEVSPMARTDAERLPPPPRLQAAPGFESLDPHDPHDDSQKFQLKHPHAEWEALQRKWDWELNNPGAVDPGTQTMRVPIKDAMRMTLEKGLPTRQQQAGESGWKGADVPSYSSAGRQTEKRDQ
ncbi:MAG: hypothetical protein LC785_09175 [Acidobacteria bacterium]|nr:hypothetical protein [Acidobacteriota bacterium]